MNDREEKENDFLSSQPAPEEKIVVPKHGHTWQWSIVIILCALAAGGIYYWQSRGAANRGTTTHQDLESNITTTTDSETVTHTNDMLGYLFVIPSELPEFSTHIETTYDERFTEYFAFAPKDPSWDNSRRIPGFTIAAIPNDQAQFMIDTCKKDKNAPWFDCLFEDSKVKGQNSIIGKNDQFTFAYTRTDKLTDYPKNFDAGFYSLINQAIDSFATKTPTYTVQTNRVSITSQNQSEEKSYPFDQKIVLIDRTSGQEKVLVKSTKEAFPELRQPENLLLVTVSYLEDVGEIYFSTTLGDTDAGLSGLYRYTLKTKLLKKLNSGDYYRLTTSTGSSLAPNQRLIITSEDPANPEREPEKVQTVFLINLQSDTTKPLLKLKGSETLFCCTNLGTTATGLQWVNTKNIEYDVYKPSGEDNNRSFLETRSVNIP